MFYNQMLQRGVLLQVMLFTHTVLDMSACGMVEWWPHRVLVISNILHPGMYAGRDACGPSSNSGMRRSLWSNQSLAGDCCVVWLAAEWLACCIATMPQEQAAAAATHQQLSFLKRGSNSSSSSCSRR